MKLTFREKLAIWKKEKHSRLKKVTWKVEIFYPIAMIITEVTAADPLTALRVALRKGLKIHGFVDDNSFSMVSDVFSKESEWFRIRRK